MIQSTQGIILRTRPFTETSLLVDWLTSDLGRLHTVARGARRPKSPFRGRLDLFFEADLSLVRSRTSSLHTLREVVVRETHGLLRSGLEPLRQASYAAALIEQTTERDAPLPAVFELLRGFLAGLSGAPGSKCALFAFELKLLRELGLQPDLSSASLTPGARQAADRLLQLDWPAIRPLRLTQSQSIELDRFLRAFLLYHLGRIPPSRGAAAKSLS
jgi:DNA repair protein RecO (recombination protein O)